MLEQQLVEKEKPSFMQRTRNFLKKKWMAVAGGAVLGGAMLLGGAQNLEAQTEAAYSDAGQRESFFGRVIKGDDPLIRGFDFVLEDFEKQNQDGEYMKILVREPIVDPSNRDLINEAKYRLNHPEQYPWIEVRGIFRPSSYGRDDGTLDLESMLITDVNINVEGFYTDPALSSFYSDFDIEGAGLMFFPGTRISRIRYPYFGLYPGLYPEFDWDMDGIPNIFDPHPTWPDNWNWGWFDPYCMGVWNLWFDWGFSPWGFHNYYGWGWNNTPFWGYYGGWQHYADDHNNHERIREINSTIRKDQLRDPNYIGGANGIMRQLVANREAHRLVLDKNQLKQRDQFVKSIDKANYEMLKRNPQIRTRDPDGKERIIRVNPSDYKPDPSTGRINTERIMRRGDEGNRSPVSPGTIRDPGSREIRERNPPSPPSPPPSSGTIKKVDEKKEGSPVIKEKDDTDRGYSLNRGQTYSPPSSRSSATSYQSRNITAYPSRVQRDDLLSRIIRQESSRIIIPNQQEVKKYSSPIIRDRSYTPWVPSQSRSMYTSPFVTSQPRASFGKTYSPSRSYSSPTIKSNSGKSSSSSKSSVNRSYSGKSSYSSSKPSSSHSSGTVRKK